MEGENFHLKGLIKEENSSQFSVKYCTRCEHSWEPRGSKKNKDTGEVEKQCIIHLGFPTYGLRRKDCFFCIKKEKMRNNENN